MSPTYPSLLIFLLGILIPAWNSSSLAFLMMCSAYELNKQGDNMQPCCTPFPSLSQSVVSCNILTVVCVRHSVMFATSWTVARQASLSVEFSRQKYWSGLPFPFPGDLPDPKIKPMSPALWVNSLLSESVGKPLDR